MNESSLTVLGIAIPWIGTILGASLVFFVRKTMPTLLQKILLGFASGVMVAASVWSLLIPSIEMGSDRGDYAIVPTALGFLLGMGFLLVLDAVTPHLHLGSDKPEGPHTQLSKTSMLTLAVTIHNIPEGMAVGVVIASALSGAPDITMASALAMSFGMAIQNIPEGAIVALPVRSRGRSRKRAFTLGALSGIVEPIGAIAIVLCAHWLTPVLPMLLAFAAGAMIYVVIEELIPEASIGAHSDAATIGFAVGFTLMMVLDVVLG